LLAVQWISANGVRKRHRVLRGNRVGRAFQTLVSALGTDEVDAISFAAEHAVGFTAEGTGNPKAAATLMRYTIDRLGQRWNALRGT
jgi:hypothetical protein